MEEEMEFPEDFEFPESYEVAEQRVRDLAEFVWAQMPSLFEVEGGDEVKGVSLTRKAIQDVLLALEDELIQSPMHRISLMAVISNFMVAAVEPHLEEAVQQFLQEQEASEDDDEDDGHHARLEVNWDDLLIKFDETSSLEHLMSLARLSLISTWNSNLWENPSWAIVHGTLNTSIPALFEGFHGAVGLQALVAYIRVSRFRDLPSIKLVDGSKDE